MFIRRLTADDLELVWALRLRALKNDPEAFGSTYEETVAGGSERMLQRLNRRDQLFYLGAFEKTLLGIVLFSRGEVAKSHHTGFVASMYVLPERRGLGIGRALMEELIAQARQMAGLEQLYLSVVTTNLVAERLYRALGFTVYGTAPRALKVGERYWDENLMVLDLRDTSNVSGSVTQAAQEANGAPLELGQTLSLSLPLTEEQIQAAHVAGATPLNGPILLVDYDPDWPRLFEREAARVRSVLGERALLLEHVGSTSVPGLAAKPKIDMLLAVANSADEAAYVPLLEAAGYFLRIREPDWHEHRLFRGPDTEINLHVFTREGSEIARMLLFRDWLRNNPDDRRLYEHTKRELARQNWKYTQNYADAKTTVVEEILTRARQAGRPADSI